MENIIHRLHDECAGNYEKLSSLIDENIKPKENDKIVLAEIPTLKELRGDMLYTLENHYWNKTIRIFEPCCGKGGFLVDVYNKLFRGLTSIFIDKKERRKNILENCLYFADINQENVEICKKLLDPKNEYNLNFYIGDTLKFDVLSFWSIKGFDLVIGNPPYNNQTGTGNGTPIWHKFVKISLNSWLIPEGHLLFVHPPGWRKPCYSRSQFQGLYKLMCHSNHMKILSIHNVKDGLKSFKCSTRYDYYLIQKMKNLHQNETIVNDEDSNHKNYPMYNLSWFPNKNIDWILNIITKDGEKCKVFCNSKYHAMNKQKISDVRDENFQYPLIHSTPKSGIRYKYSNYNDKGHFGISKVIFGESGIHHVVIDMEGKYGLTQGAIGIIVRDIVQAQGLQKALMSEKFKKLLDRTLFGNFRIDWRLFTHFNENFYLDFI
tara:strand:- start:95 stop:1393 length:1299 start_codon:yes stop_codon:yes gene_type:complete